MATTLTKSSAQTEVAVKIVDVDVHPTVMIDQFAAEIPEPWRTQYFGKSPAASISGLYGSVMSFHRLDTVPPSGGSPGTDPDFAAKQLFVDEKVDYAVLIPMGSTGAQVYNPELETAYLSGLNSYISQSWLGKYNANGRFKGSIAITPTDPTGAAREIEKWAGHPHFVQVSMPLGARTAFGHPDLDPIWRAAERNGLPIEFHFVSTAGPNWLTPVGWPAYYLEAHSSAAQHQAIAHVASLIFSGVFERFPKLKMLWVEAGYTWVAPLMSRLDNNWRRLGAEIPHLKRAPSEVIKEHMRFSTQPVEDVTPFSDLLRMLEFMDAKQTMCFSTDYPHHDGDDPAWILPRLPVAWREAIMGGNARELYGMPATRPVDSFDLARQ